MVCLFVDPYPTLIQDVELGYTYTQKDTLTIH